MANQELREMIECERELDDALGNLEMAVQAGITNPLLWLIIPPIWAIGSITRGILRWAIKCEQRSPDG